LTEYYNYKKSLKDEENTIYFFSNAFPEAHILQPAQFPPQLDFPCFLSFIIVLIIRTTAKISISDTTIEPKLSEINAIIKTSP